MGYIYILTSPNGKTYIGQTIRSIEKRIEDHQLKSSKCIAIRDAIQKYGWTNFEKDWYECPDDELNKHEKWMVKLMGTLAPDGYNLMEGGGSGGKRSEETKQKMREGQLGEKNHNYGKTASEETNRKHGDSIKGDKHYASRRVYRYGIDGTFIDSFGSTEEAGRHLNKKSASNIRSCARDKTGRHQTAYNFIWSFDPPVL